MNIFDEISSRAQGECELCSSQDNLSLYTLPPKEEESLDHTVLLCDSCLKTITSPLEVDNIQKWRCLGESMWSEHTAVQVLTYRVLDLLGSLDWALELKSQMYLSDEDLNWAMASKVNEVSHQVSPKDCHGQELSSGDHVSLIKDLVVKGGNFTAKRGTLVKGIYVGDDPKYVEGKINGTQIVLIAAFVKKV